MAAVRSSINKRYAGIIILEILIHDDISINIAYQISLRRADKHLVT